MSIMVPLAQCAEEHMMQLQPGAFTQNSNRWRLLIVSSLRT